MKLALRVKKSRNGTRRSCAGCGKKAKGDEAFCISCGAPLEHLDGTATEIDHSDRETALIPAEEALPLPLPPSATVEAPIAHGRRYWRPWMRSALASLLALIVLILIGGFAYLWHSERTKHHAASQGLNQANAQIDELTATKARLSAQLADEQELAAKRAAVLKRADNVLQGVEPLLSSVDELKSITGEMRSQRDTFSSDSDILVADLVRLANYLLAPGANDYSYVSGLISDINSELSTVRSDQDSLAGSDDNYDAASGRFDTRATGLTKSVRALEKQLRLVTK